MKPENQFRASVHKHLEKNVHQEKMSNPWRSGTFDDWYSGFAADLWVEYKWQGIFGSVLANLSPLQFRWGDRRYNEGRNVAVIVGMPQGGLILKKEEWTVRVPKMEVESRLIKRKQIAEILYEFCAKKHPKGKLQLWELQ